MENIRGKLLKNSVPILEFEFKDGQAIVWEVLDVFSLPYPIIRNHHNPELIKDFASSRLEYLHKDYTDANIVSTRCTTIYDNFQIEAELT